MSVVDPYPATTLALKVAKPARSTKGLALFSVIRDEDYFLPFFFEHYRALGIETFLIYDDRSGEPTKTFLHAQPDCTVLTSGHAFGDVFGAMERYGARRLPTALRESVPMNLFPDRWVLTADADEFLFLPPGFGDLAALTTHLDAAGQPYLTAPMVDFYGATLNHRRYAPDLSPFAANPYFDAGPYYHWHETLRPNALAAGVRYRLQVMLYERHPATFLPMLEEGLYVPYSWKVPLLKNGAGVVRSGDHELNIAPRAGLSGALAHFKFYPGLDAKIDQAVREGQYTGKSLHYRFLDAARTLLGDESLVCDATRRFAGAGSLQEAGLIVAPGD